MNRFAYAPVDRHAAAVKAAATRARRDSEAAADAEKAGRTIEVFEVGDILYGSWGYDQTNVEFYQVVARTAKTVTLREVVTFSNPQPVAMTETVWPCKDRFTTAAPIRRMVSRWGTVKLYDFGCGLSKWNGAGKTASHYA